MNAPGEAPRGRADLLWLPVAFAASAAALWPVVRNYPGEPSLAIGLLAALWVEALDSRSAGGLRAACFRAGAFGLAGAAAAMHGRALETPLVLIAAIATAASGARELAREDSFLARPRFVGAVLIAVAQAGCGRVDLEAAVLFAIAASLALARPASERLARVALALVVPIVLLRPTDVPWAALEGRTGRIVGIAAVWAIGLGVLYAIARAVQPRGALGARAIAAGVLALVITLLELGTRVMQPTPSSVVIGDAVPLATIDDGLRIFEPGRAARPDFRGRTFAPDKPDGVVRIALLGGSTAYGFALANEAAPAARIEAHLARRTRSKLEVLCLAHPGFTSDQELAIVLGYALDWQVSVFLAIDGVNDVAYLSGQDTFPGDIFNWPQHAFSLEHPGLRALEGRSKLLAHVFERPLTKGDWLENGGGVRLDPGKANGWFQDGLVSNEESIAVLAKESGARFAWSFATCPEDRGVVVPEGNMVKGPRRAEVLRRIHEARARVGPAVTARGGVVLDVPARVARLAETTRDVIWFSDTYHWNERGSDAIASAIADALVEQGVVGP